MRRRPRYASIVINRVRGREMAQVIRAARRALDLLDAEIDYRILRGEIHDFDAHEIALLARYEQRASIH